MQGPGGTQRPLSVASVEPRGKPLVMQGYIVFKGRLHGLHQTAETIAMIAKT